MENEEKTYRKEQFVKHIKSCILSGELKPGDRLPTERELAAELGISRSSVNQGILDLERSGFLRIAPRKGTFVADYIKDSTPETLSAVMDFDSSSIDMSLFKDFMDMRILIERECLRLACQRMTPQKLLTLTSAAGKIFACEQDKLPDAIYNFHETLTSASDNAAYHMIFRSFEKIIKAMLQRHYESGTEYMRVLPLYSSLVVELSYGNAEKADSILKKILSEAAAYLIS